MIRLHIGQKEFSQISWCTVFLLGKFHSQQTWTQNAGTVVQKKTIGRVAANHHKKVRNIVCSSNMMPSSPFARQFRCAVYLNNAAATFLARGDYVEACLSSRESLSLMESIVRPSDTFENISAESIDCSLLHEPFESISDLSKKIQHVDKRLAATHAKTATSFLPVEILYLDGSLDSRRTLHETKDIWNAKEIAMPIWISDVIVDEIDDIDELYRNLTEVVPAAMLLNYAIAHLCYYKHSKCHGALVGSLRLFHMAMNVLCIHDKGSSSTADLDNDHNYSEGRLFLAMAIVSNMKCLLAERGNSSFQQSHAEACSSSISMHQLDLLLLLPEIMDDFAALQKISDEWIAFSRFMHIETLRCSSNAGAA